MYSLTNHQSLGVKKDFSAGAEHLDDLANDFGMFLKTAFSFQI